MRKDSLTLSSVFTAERSPVNVLDRKTTLVREREKKKGPKDTPSKHKVGYPHRRQDNGCYETCEQ